MDELLSPLGVTYEVDGIKITLVMADGSKPPGTPPPAGTARRQMPLPEPQTLVTLKSPYVMLEYKNGDPQERISVTFAVRSLCNQAGYKLNWNKSKENVGELIRRWVYPEIENVTWEEAMKELLDPLGLGYEVEGGMVVLIKK